MSKTQCFTIIEGQINISTQTHTHVGVSRLRFPGRCCFKGKPKPTGNLCCFPILTQTNIHIHTHAYGYVLFKGSPFWRCFEGKPKRKPLILPFRHTNTHTHSLSFLVLFQREYAKRTTHVGGFPILLHAPAHRRILGRNFPKGPHFQVVSKRKWNHTF